MSQSKVDLPPSIATDPPSPPAASSQRRVSPSIAQKITSSRSDTTESEPPKKRHRPLSLNLKSPDSSDVALRIVSPGLPPLKSAEMRSTVKISQQIEQQQRGLIASRAGLSMSPAKSSTVFASNEVARGSSPSSTNTTGTRSHPIPVSSVATPKIAGIAHIINDPESSPPNGVKRALADGNKSDSSTETKSTKLLHENSPPSNNGPTVITINSEPTTGTDELDRLSTPTTSKRLKRSYIPSPLDISAATVNSESLRPMIQSAPIRSTTSRVPLLSSRQQQFAQRRYLPPISQIKQASVDGSISAASNEDETLSSSKPSNIASGIEFKPDNVSIQGVGISAIRGPAGVTESIASTAPTVEPQPAGSYYIPSGHYGAPSARAHVRPFPNGQFQTPTNVDQSQIHYPHPHLQQHIPSQHIVYHHPGQFRRVRTVYPYTTTSAHFPRGIRPFKGHSQPQLSGSGHSAHFRHSPMSSPVVSTSVRGPAPGQVNAYATATRGGPATGPTSIGVPFGSVTGSVNVSSANANPAATSSNNTASSTSRSKPYSVTDVYHGDLMKVAPLVSQPLSAQREYFESRSANAAKAKLPEDLEDDRLPVSEDEVREMQEKYKNSEQEEEARTKIRFGNGQRATVQPQYTPAYPHVPGVASYYQQQQFQQQAHHYYKQQQSQQAVNGQHSQVGLGQAQNPESISQMKELTNGEIFGSINLMNESIFNFRIFNQKHKESGNDEDGAEQGSATDKNAESEKSGSVENSERASMGRSSNSPPTSGTSVGNEKSQAVLAREKEKFLKICETSWERFVNSRKSPQT
ncbi:uncharacterized protein RJT20DRAFT_51332 [Scheffersomyces xylosifermentans]|uniref:uncharacterized protein n=1 Tax=Scheffersomyces xylosifermentans TaxID=1304137 RepID=UPI00315D6A2B